jgi:hypothetical protein
MWHVDQGGGESEDCASREEAEERTVVVEA